jgi:hypothetical protein
MKITSQQEFNERVRAGVFICHDKLLENTSF